MKELTKETGDAATDARNTLRWIVEWAYEHGVHELGYDPIRAFEQAIRQEVQKDFEGLA